MLSLKQGIMVPKASPKIVSNNRGLSDTTRTAASDSAQLTNTPNVYDHVALQERARSYARASLAPNTKIAYARAWRAFRGWCRTRELSALPASPATVSLYLAAKASTLKVSTLSLAVSAIRHAHRMAGLNFDVAHPEVRAVFAGIRRQHGRQLRKSSPFTVELLKSSLTLLSNSGGLRNHRNAALLALGFCAALRRSELATLKLGDIEFVAEGIKLHLTRRKTDQEARGTSIGIPFGQFPASCPVTTVRNWLAIRATASNNDWLFPAISKSGKVSSERISGRDVARIVKEIAKAHGLPIDTYSAHSLRAGFVTSAAVQGVSERQIMAQTGHRSVTVMRGYIRDASIFQDNPIRALKL